MPLQTISTLPDKLFLNILRILTECELVKQEQQGREIYYSLEIKKMKEIDKWLEQFRKIWEDQI